MIDNLLKKLKACEEALVWAEGKSWQEIYNTCPRGGWLLWLFSRTNPGDKRQLVLAKAHCANTVRHLMKDERSIKAVDAAIAYGEGRITDKELDVAVDAAVDAYAAYVACVAVDAAVDAYAAYAAYAAGAAVDAYAAVDANRQLTADICRKYLPIEIWNIEEDSNNEQD